MNNLLKQLHPRQAFLTFVQEAVVLLLISSPLLSVLINGCFSFTCLSELTPFYFLPLSILAIYGAFVEPYKIVTKYYNLDVKVLTKKFRIVFFTDIHAGPYKRKKFVQKIVDKVNNLRADLVLIGGDFITGVDWHTNYLSPLKSLESNFSIIAVLGNHDYNINFRFEKPREMLAKKVVEKLRLLNIKVLKNQSLKLDFEGGPLNIVGIDDVWAKKDSLEKAYKNVGGKYPVILLCHNPDIVYKLGPKHKVDILLSGHTHGGTFRIPSDGPLLPFIRNTRLASKFSKGFHLFKKVPLFVTSGLGTSVTRMRFLFNFPEIIVFDLK